MTLLDILWIVIALNVGFILGLFWYSIAQQEECFKCREKMCQDCEFKEALDNRCFNCKHIYQPLDTVSWCNVKNDYVFSDNVACENFQKRN